ncbi:MAG: hypothetical protein M3Q64_03470 [bacterium]|nr:hypothetical protein [bacterium]
MANIGIADEDVTLVTRLKESKVIRPIDLEKLVLGNGTMFGSCSDSKHFKDKIQHLEKLLEDKGSADEIFPIPRGGGMIWLAKSILLESVGIPRDLDILFDIRIGIEKRHHTSLLLSVHAPCGAAADFNLSVFDQIELLILGKERVEEEFSYLDPKLTIYTLFHICYSADKRRTYHVSPEKWNEVKKDLKYLDYSPEILFNKSSMANT